MKKIITKQMLLNLAARQVSSRLTENKKSGRAIHGIAEQRAKFEMQKGATVTGAVQRSYDYVLGLQAKQAQRNYA